MKASQLTKENITPEIVDKLLFEGLDYKGETADVIIVLGSRKACDYRVPLAAKLFHEGKAPNLIFCGGKVQNTSQGEMEEYKAMLIAAEKCGIPTSAITVETHSLDTVEKLCRKGNTIVAGFAASQNYYNVGSFAFIVKTLEKKLVYYFGGDVFFC
jgi:small ligand-binding sensory domain FIST